MDAHNLRSRLYLFPIYNMINYFHIIIIDLNIFLTRLTSRLTYPNIQMNINIYIYIYIHKRIYGRRNNHHCIINYSLYNT